jgi:hypothetical protein
MNIEGGTFVSAGNSIPSDDLGTEQLTFPDLSQLSNDAKCFYSVDPQARVMLGEQQVQKINLWDNPLYTSVLGIQSLILQLKRDT